MVINDANLRAIYQGFNTIYNKAFAEAEPQYQKIATVVPSTTGEETYAWLGDIPGMREWIGDREIQNLTASDYTVKNKSFELTVGLPREAVEDDKIGLYNPSVQMLGQSAAMHPDELVFGLLKRGTTEKCYDGQAFFSDSHKIGKKTVSNKGKKKLGAESYAAARSSMMSITNSKGRPLRLIPDLLVVPPSLESTARKIIKADEIEGTTNTMKDTAEILVLPDLADQETQWYLLCTRRPVKPLIYQQRKPAKFVAKTNETDDNVFFSKQFLYGVDSRGNAGFGFWQMAYYSEGTEA